MQRLSRPPVQYPDSDGKPMAENTLQFRWIVTIKEGLEALFRDRPDVFVAGDLLWYPIEGNNKIRMAPDALVAFGRPKGHRGSYQQWKEGGIAPQAVFEVLSPGNYPKEMAEKRAFYEQHGVQDYVVYDPEQGTLDVWVRIGDQLVLVEQPQGWVSPRLGVRLELDGVDLVLTGPDGRPFHSYPDLFEDRERKQARAEQERLRAEQADARAEQEQARAEQQRLRAEQEQARAEQQRLRAEQEQARAEQQRLRAEQEHADAMQERARAEQADARAEQADARAERLAERLRALGIDPEQD